MEKTKKLMLRDETESIQVKPNDIKFEDKMTAAAEK